MLPPELSGPWACADVPLRAIMASVPATAAGWNRSSPGSGSFELWEDVAIIHLAGVLTKAGSWWFGGTSTIGARHQLAAALADSRVNKIALAIDSPGGTVDGTYELAAGIAAAGKVKTTVAYIQDLGASAAYWAASQASQVFASPTAYVGAIGTYGVLIDSSGMADKVGVKVHVVRAGAFKGMATPGTPIEKSHLAEAQRLIDGRNEFFLNGVAAGRNLPLAKVRELADGRVHLAADAQRLGLIDGVQTFQQTLARLAVTGTGHASTAAGSGPTAKGKIMDEFQGDACAEVAARVEAKMANGRMTKAEATREVLKADPALHQAWIRQYNENAQAERERRYHH